MSTTTVTAAAAELGVTPGRVRQLCQQHGIGEMLTPRMRLLSDKDLRTLNGLIGTPRGPVPRKKSAKRKKHG